MAETLMQYGFCTKLIVVWGQTLSTEARDFLSRTYQYYQFV